VIFAVILSSCSNDDIPVGQSITFKVNPSTVVSSLLEFSPGDLSSIDSDENLYVSLYIYNEAGALVSSEVQKFKDYTHIMNSVQSIEAGEYTVVASTQIIDDEDFKYWEITGIDNLSTFNVKDKGYIGGSAKILGLSAQKINVTSSTKEVSINVECAGAVALVQMLNWNRYSNISDYGLVANKSCDDVTLDYDGGLNYSVKSKSSYSYWLVKWNYNSAYSGAYSYTFMFPYTNINLAFVAVTTSGSNEYLGDECTGNIEKNHTYWFAYDVQEEETYWSDATNWDQSTEKAPTMRARTNSAENMLNFDPKEKVITIVK
jgi:hypothetical protein